jgi:hypothetical protein
VLHQHDCPGRNRADALWADDDGALFVGCGSGAEGAGLYMSADAGETWSVPETDPPNVLADFRVMSIHRGHGDLLYLGGTGRAMVLALDTSVTPFAATAILTAGDRVGQSFTAAPFVTTSGGAAFADSFTGHDALYRPAPEVGAAAAEWTEAGAWETPDGSHQILDMVVHDDRFYGCGSTIAEPPQVFLPAKNAAEPWRMTPVDLAGEGLGAWTGEMWGLAVSADRVVVVGVDQQADAGKIFVSGADPYDAAGYAQIEVNRLVPGDATWARGVCMRGDRIVVVGQSRAQPGWILISEDGGQSWTDQTPPGSPGEWSKCRIRPDGRVIVAGGDGRVGVL